MRVLSHLTLMLSLLFGAAQCARAQSSQTASTGTITGRVMIGDKPAQGVAVMLMSGESYSPMRKPTARATTDADGQFRLQNIAAGRYEVLPVAPVYILQGGRVGFRGQGKSINLNDGETIDKIDFTLVRGGVITGRITDADGRPLIGEHPRLAQAAPNVGDERREPFFFNSFLFETDDRGVYRFYGIPPGRYVVSLGEDSKSGMITLGYGRGGRFTRTFHPGVTDESKANVIEVTEGSEATNVDIMLGRRAETYAATGRVIDAETGKPVPNLSAGYGSLSAEGKQLYSFGIGTRTDAEGNFRFDGLISGRYAAFVSPGEQSEDYSVPVTFEVIDGDVTGLVVKVRRGASISGMVSIEGTSDRSVLARVSQLRVVAYPESEQLAAPFYGEGGRVNVDGSFRLVGLGPGKVRVMLGGWPPLKGFSLLRVERDGVEQRAGLMQLSAGSQVSGVRVVLEYGTGVLRGQVRVENGQLPEGTRLYVSARRPSQSEPSLPGAEVDARGRFVMEGLPPGEYQLRMAGRLGQRGQRIPPVVQNVNVTNGTETEVTLTLDLNAKEETRKP